MQSWKQGDPGLKAWPMFGILSMQAFLCLAHWFIYRTFVVFQGNLSPAMTLVLGNAIFLLAFSFIAAALLGFTSSNWLVVGLYRVAAVWLGFLNFFFFAACLSWVAWFALLLSGLSHSPLHFRPLIAAVLFTLAALTGLYGLINARWIHIRRIPVTLPNLPESWRARTALVVSDLHLGHVNGVGFSRRIARMAARLNPDIVFIPGDLFDGTKSDPGRLAAPFKELSPPFGIYFSTGNHEEFGHAERYCETLARAGVRVLANEKVTVDGLQIVGIFYRDSTQLHRVHATLDALRLDRGHASILLSHAPNRLPIVEQAGVSLQISGHTHGGQLFPFTWFVRHAFGEFTLGLQRFGTLQVYTSSGAGTWGPPMRVGSSAEIVLLRFE
jgi:predicted MPP superfamily phosphohydrolase